MEEEKHVEMGVLKELETWTSAEILLQTIVLLKAGP